MVCILSKKYTSNKMDRNLFEASLIGNIQALNELLEKDQLILERVSLTYFNETPLHIAALKGHLHFVTTLLTKRPILATSTDSLRRTPLHLASAEGHVEIVRELVKVMGPDGCRLRDQDGMTPLHLAAINERLEIIKVMIQIQPDLGKELLENGETILHTCISYNRFEALKLLAQLWNETELCRLTDRNGNTLLHVAVANKQIQTVKYLLQKSSIKTNGNAVNGHGLTAPDVLDHIPRDFVSLEIQTLLMESNILRSKNVPPLHTSPESKSLHNVTDLDHNPKGCISRIWNWYLNNNGNWLEKQRGILILAAIVMATASFYSGLHPPGGTFTNSRDGPLGNAVQTEGKMDDFNSFVMQNTIIMVISLMILLVLLSGIPLRNKFCLWVLHLATVCIVFFVTVTYLQVIASMSPDGWVNGSTLYLCFAWILLSLLFGFVHTVLFIIWVVKKLKKGRRMTRDNELVRV